MQLQRAQKAQHRQIHVPTYVHHAQTVWQKDILGSDTLSSCNGSDDSVSCPMTNDYLLNFHDRSAQEVALPLRDKVRGMWGHCTFYGIGLQCACSELLFSTTSNIQCLSILGRNTTTGTKMSTRTPSKISGDSESRVHSTSRRHLGYATGDLTFLPRDARDSTCLRAYCRCFIQRRQMKQPAPAKFRLPLLR